MDRLVKELNIKETRSIHITGTNGKGSVAWKIRSGLSTGLFISPHLSSIRERIQFSDNRSQKEKNKIDMISEDDFVRYFNIVHNVIKKNSIDATFFEYLTTMALYAFDDKKIDVSIFEVGLGGKMDSTNIINSDVAIITSIGLDHLGVIGNNLEEIAQEKVGIVKTNKTSLVIGTEVDIKPTIQLIMQNHCKSVSAEFIPDRNTYDSIISSDFNMRNSILAQRAIEIFAKKMNMSLSLSSDELLSKLQDISPPCRFEKVTSSKYPNSLFILDSAHNPPAIENLLMRVKSKMNYPKEKIKIIYAASSDKDIKACIKTVLSSGIIQPQNIIFTHARSSRSLQPEKFKDIVDIPNPVITNTIPEAMQIASMGGDNVILVFGTMFMMAETRMMLGIKEAYDDLDVINHEMERLTPGTKD